MTPNASIAAHPAMEIRTSGSDSLPPSGSPHPGSSPTRRGRPRVSSACLLALTLAVAGSSTGCALTLPPRIGYRYFQSQFADSDQPYRRIPNQTREAGLRCARRVDSHRDRAGSFHAVRTTLTALGGATASVGGVLTLALPQQSATATTITAVAGGVVALVGTFVGSLIADPTQELALHGRSYASWRRGLDALDRQDYSAARQAMEDCADDRAAPETPVVAQPRATPVTDRSSP